ncbi:MAG TPA: Hsp20/alpha crystallin family protein [Bryobacteraceae bacterium]|nr:Hsp20/alpha crystallin family protein [Bryobacteraceae bacterium]
MELARFNAYNDFPTGMQLFHDAINRLLNDENQVRPWSPAVDIFETETELFFKVDAAGMSLEDIDVQLENGTMTLKGERKFEKDDKVKGYHRIERSYGAFARSFTLPNTVDPEGVRADYTHGVLTITLPKKELAKPRAIKVNVN